MTFIYVAVDHPQCKIGFTNNPGRRARELYNPCHFPRRPWRPKLRRVWDVGDKALHVERAVVAALLERAVGPSWEWFEIGWRDMYRTVDACIERVVGCKIPGQRAALLTKPGEKKPTISQASLRRHYL